MIPVIKLVMIVSKTLAKPFIAGIKKLTNKHHGKFRNGYIMLGNKFYIFETHVNEKFMGVE